MIGKLDKEIIEKFKEFQEKTGKHSELYIEDVEFEKVNADKTNDYFMIYNGQRLKKSDLENIKDSLDDPIEVYSATESNEEVFGYIERKKLLKISPNHRIYNGKTVLLNTGGSVGAVRFKNNDFDYTVIDNVIVYVAKQDIFSIDYLYFSLKAIIKNDNFGYSNTLRGKDLEKANLIIPLPKDLNKFYPSFQIQEAIVEFLEFWKDGYTDVIRDKVSKKKPIYESIKRIVVQNTFKDDKFLIEKFNDYTKDRGFHLKFGDIKFTRIDIFNDEKNIELIGSKKIGSHDELKKINDQDGIPVYDASANILTYVKQEKYLNEIFTVDNNDNPDISFASEGNSSAGTNFIIHKNSYFVNNHRTVIKFSNKYYGKYVYYNIYRMKEKYGFRRGYIPSQKELKRLKIMICIPEILGDTYNSFEIQKMLVEFWEMIIKQIDDNLAIYQRMIELTDIIDRAFLYRTFSKIDWST